MINWNKEIYTVAEAKEIFHRGLVIGAVIVAVIWLIIEKVPR